MSVAISIENVIKRFGKDTIINGLSLDVRPGEFFTLLGPSGCGKTTLLRMIIGFNSIEGGEIKIDGKVINNIPTNKRNMGMVFQNYAIFPHMSVRDNVAFGLKNRKVPQDQIESQVDEILKVVKIDHLKKRMPSKLSGGQQQRVALARAIVIHPEVLLMDEPLSNLDAKLRVEMRNAIKRIQQQVGITTLYVTHDQEEAINMSDRIVVMRDGQFEQIGTPDEIYNRPKTSYVADFVGNANIISGVVERIDGELTDIRVNSRLITAKTVDGLKEGGRAVVAVRRENIKVCRQCKKGLPAVITDKSFNAGQLHMVFKLEDGKEVVASHYGIDTDLTVDQKVCVGWEPEHAVFVDMDEAAQGA